MLPVPKFSFWKVGDNHLTEVMTYDTSCQSPTVQSQDPSMMELGNILQRFHTFTQLSDRMTQCFFHSLTHVTSQMIINVSATLKTTSSSHWRLILF